MLSLHFWKPFHRVEMLHYVLISLNKYLDLLQISTIPVEWILTFVYSPPAFPSLGPFQQNKFLAPILPNGARKQHENQLPVPTAEKKKMNRLCYKFLLKNLEAPVKAQFCNFKESDLQYILILFFTNTKGKWVISF